MSEIAERDVVWYERDKRRHAIVIRVDRERGRAVVVWGTGTLKDGPGYANVRVDPAERASKALELWKPTYFYARNMEVASLAKLEPRGLRCPLDLYLAVREMLGFRQG